MFFFSKNEFISLSYYLKKTKSCSTWFSQKNGGDFPCIIVIVCFQLLIYRFRLQVLCEDCIIFFILFYFRLWISNLVFVPSRLYNNQWRLPSWYLSWDCHSRQLPKWRCLTRLQWNCRYNKNHKLCL